MVKNQKRRQIIVGIGKIVYLEKSQPITVEDPENWTNSCKN